jgi:hypothetical protein
LRTALTKRSNSLWPVRATIRPPFDAEHDRQRDHALGVQVRILDRAFV